MTGYLQPIAESCALIVELIGVLMLTLLTLASLAMAVYRLFRGESHHQIWSDTRKQLGRSILLGLEFLIAADIIHTVAVELTYETVSVLAIIVLIRTFLSFTLELELTGSWPWQKQGPTDPEASG